VNKIKTDFFSEKPITVEKSTFLESSTLEFHVMSRDKMNADETDR